MSLEQESHQQASQLAPASQGKLEARCRLVAWVPTRTRAQSPSLPSCRCLPVPRTSPAAQIALLELRRWCCLPPEHPGSPAELPGQSAAHRPVCLRLAESPPATACLPAEVYQDSSRC